MLKKILVFVKGVCSVVYNKMAEREIIFNVCVFNLRKEKQQQVDKGSKINSTLDGQLSQKINL